MISMDKLRVYMLRAGKEFEGSTSEVCEQISKQIDSDLAILHDEKIVTAYDSNDGSFLSDGSVLRLHGYAFLSPDGS
jgi:hypothetical protein